MTKSRGKVTRGDPRALERESGSSRVLAAPPAAAAAFRSPFRKGEIVAGKYQIDELIGVGGIAFVVSATHTELHDKVALKFLRPESLANHEAVRRFAEEARLAVKIKSDYVARVFDVGRLPDGAPFIVMELLEGQDLSQVIAAEGRLPSDRAAAYMLQVCEALATAHAAGVIHRDIKPDNLFLTRQKQGPDVIKVLDFGISKAGLDLGANGRASTLTRTVMALGSPPYMSPEQMRAAEDIDPRTDIWSLGCVLYELLSGATPFQAPSLMQVCAVVLEHQPRSLSALVPGISTKLEAIIMRCLEKDPNARFQDVAELALALLPFAPMRARVSVERCMHVLQSAKPAAAADLEASQARASRISGTHPRTRVGAAAGDERCVPAAEPAAAPPSRAAVSPPPADAPLASPESVVAPLPTPAPVRLPVILPASALAFVESPPSEPPPSAAELAPGSAIEPASSRAALLLPPPPPPPSAADELGPVTAVWAPPQVSARPLPPPPPPTTLRPPPITPPPPASGRPSIEPARLAAVRALPPPPPTAADASIPESMLELLLLDAAPWYARRRWQLLGASILVASIAGVYLRPQAAHERERSSGQSSSQPHYVSPAPARPAVLDRGASAPGAAQPSTARPGAALELGVQPVMPELAAPPSAAEVAALAPAAPPSAAEVATPELAAASPIAAPVPVLEPSLPVGTDRVVVHRVTRLAPNQPKAVTKTVKGHVLATRAPAPVRAGAQHSALSSAKPVVSPPVNDARARLADALAPAPFVGAPTDPLERAEPKPVVPSAQLPSVETNPYLAAVPAPKPSVATPPPTPTSSKPAAPAPAPGHVDPRAVAATVRAHAREVESCFERAQMEHPDLQGRVVLDATVDASGHVISTSSSSQLPNGARLTTCILSAARQWQFPAPAGNVAGKLSYTFVFD